MNLIQYLAVGWLSICIRNKEDRQATMNFLNGLGNSAEKLIKDFLPKGGIKHEPVGTTDPESFT